MLKMLYTMYSLLILFAAFASAIPLNPLDIFSHEKRQSTARYMFAFGDSYTRIGFSWSGALPSAANPIGNPAFPSTQVTVGTGNLNWIEHLTATYNSTGLILTYDVGSGGSVVNRSIINPVVTTTDLVGQISLWDSNAAKKQRTGAWTKDNALFLFWFGVNDVYRGYNTTSNLDALYTRDINNLFSQATHLYNAGAKKFIFLGVPPIHRSPLVQSLPQSTESVENLWNTKLQSTLKSWTASHTVYTHYIDTTAPFNEVLDNPTKYGAKNNTCFNSDGKTCLWWDHFHPGAAIHKAVAQKVASQVLFFTQ